MEHKESLLKKAEGELKAKGNNKIKCSCTDAVSEERCKTCIAVNHPQYLKVQSELKAIKARIEAVTITKLLATTFKEACIGCKYIGSGCGCIAIDSILRETTNRLIKQIGGDK
jgi:hypothetical protein